MGLIYYQSEITSLFTCFFVYDQILDDRISLNRTQSNIIAYKEKQTKNNNVDELCLSINDRVSAHTIMELYNRNAESCEMPYLSDYERACLTWVNIDNGLMGSMNLAVLTLAVDFW
jgi:hypothetical protein